MGVRTISATFQMVSTQRVVLGALLVYLTPTSAAGAPTPKLTLPSVLSSDAVLPAAGAIVWGRAPTGAKVRVDITGAHHGSYSVTAGASDGNWEVSLPDIKPSLVQSNISISSGVEKLTLERVLFGELVLCGGQVRAERVVYA